MQKRRQDRADGPRIPTSPVEMLAAYVRAFVARRTEEVADFYLLPCTFVRPDGVWIVQDRPTALVLVGHLLDHARSQGHARTETSGLFVRPLAATLAELSGTFIRYDADGSECGRFGFTYVVRADASQWKIVVAVAHEPVDLADRRRKGIGTRPRTGAVAT